MKKIIGIVLMAMLVATMLGQNLIASLQVGPAPNSGDGVSDGSGIIPEPNGDGVALGGAPNSGDGVSDGSGW